MLHYPVFLDLSYGARILLFGSARSICSDTEICYSLPTLDVMIRNDSINNEVTINRRVEFICLHHDES